MGNGIVYFADREHFYQEALQSARSLRAAMPTVPIAIFCNRTEIDPLFDLRRPLEEGVYPFLLKPRVMRDTPFDDTVFLDADTLIAADFSEIYALLERFDLAAVQSVIRLATNLDPRQSVFLAGIPECFPEFNTGVIAYRRSKAVLATLAEWERIYAAQLEGPLKPFNWDQLAFREAAYRSTLRIATLPAEYNYRFNWPNSACGTIKIFHGRHPRPHAMCETVNQLRGPRTTAPLKDKGSVMYLRDA